MSAETIIVTATTIAVRALIDGIAALREGAKADERVLLLDGERPRWVQRAELGGSLRGGHWSGSSDSTGSSG